MFSSFSIVMFFAVIFGVLFNQFSRIYFKNSHNVGASLILAQLCAGLGGLLWFFLFPANFKMSWQYWILLLLACIFYALNDRLGSEVKKNMDVSVFSLLNKTSSVFLIILSIIFFRQIPSTWKLIGAFCVLVGQFILFYRKGKIEFSKYLIMALIANLFYSFAVSIDIGISDKINLGFYVFLTMIIPALLISLFERIYIKQIMDEYKNTNKFYLVLAGLSWGSVIVFLLSAYQFGSVISVVVINAVAVVANVLIGIFLQKEYKNLAQKLIALICVVFGIVITLVNK